MKEIKYMYVLITTLAVIFLLISAQNTAEQVNTLTEQMCDLRGNFERLEQDDKTDAIQSRLDSLTEQINSLQQGQQTLRERTDFLSRGDRPEKQTMTVTAYDLSYQSCQKHPDHPLYGITASGEKVREWYTVAAGPSIPLGTKIYIPYFRDKPNGGMFTVQDRGGGIKDGRLDVYMQSYHECMKFGRRELEVYVIKENKI